MRPALPSATGGIAMLAVAPLPQTTPAPSPVLTSRGQAAALIIQLEDLWSSLTADDRRWLAPALEELTQQAAVVRADR